MAATFDSDGTGTGKFSLKSMFKIKKLRKDI
jgi:hypothetical protein